MSDISQGPGWWQASDDRWYPPDAQPGPDPAPPPGPAGWPQPYGTAHDGEAVPSAAPPSYGSSPSGQQPWGQPAYGVASPYGAYAAGPSVQGQATASMVLGILALITFFCWFVAIVLALISLPLGLVALSKIKSGQAIEQGRGMAVAGVVCSAIALVLSVGVLLLVVGS